MPNSVASQWQSPLTVETLSRYGGLDFEIVRSEFEPAAHWEMVWQIWTLTPRPQESNHRGFIRLRKRAGNVLHKTFVLSIEQQVLNQSSLDIQQCDLVCANDSYATPLRWSKTFRLTDLNRKQEVQGVRFVQQGQVLKHLLKLSGLHYRTSGPITSNWSLLEAVQRLARNGGESLDSFTLLEELEKIKENQQLRLLKEQTITIGGQAVQVQCYQQSGEGILPWLYYLDDQGRLLVAISGLRAYILNPQTLKIHQQILQK